MTVEREHQRQEERSCCTTNVMVLSREVVSVKSTATQQRLQKDSMSNEA
jgi:hypothetical protein